MNRAEYRTARRKCRDEGRRALQLLPPQHAQTLHVVMFAEHADLLAERQYLYETMGWGIHLAKSIARHHAAIRSVGQAF